jgi:hypothetical protein
MLALQCPNQIPDTHCTKPIALAKGTKSKNPQACGTKYMKSLLKSKKKTLRKAAEKSYCMNTPVSPQETYFQCRYSDMECVSSGIAEASGQAALMGLLLAAIFGGVAGLLGIPLGEKGKKGKAEKGGNPIVRALLTVVNKCKGAKPAKVSPEEKAEMKKQEEEDRLKAIEEEELEEVDIDDRFEALEDALARALKRLAQIDANAPRWPPLEHVTLKMAEQLGMVINPSGQVSGGGPY